MVSKKQAKKKNCISYFEPQIVITYENTGDLYGKYLLCNIFRQGLFWIDVNNFYKT